MLRDLLSRAVAEDGAADAGWLREARVRVDLLIAAIPARHDYDVVVKEQFAQEWEDDNLREPFVSLCRAIGEDLTRLERLGGGNVRRHAA